MVANTYYFGTDTAQSYHSAFTGIGNCTFHIRNLLINPGKSKRSASGFSMHSVTQPDMIIPEN